MELLIVMAILIVIMAIALPLVMNQWGQANEKEAAARIRIFGNALESYKLDRGTYPTTQQGGLLCLIGQGTTVAPNATTPGTLGTTPLGGDGFSGAAPVGFGAGAGDPSGGFGSPNGMNGGMPPAGMDGMPIDGASPSTFGAPAAIPGAVGTDGANATTFGPGGAAAPVGTTGGTGIQGAGSGKRYLDFAEIPKDPWGEPYYYEYPTHKTGDGRPAIWSSGPDKISGNDDDVISWKEHLDDVMKDPQKFEQYKQRQSQPLPGQTGTTIPGQPNNIPGQNGMFPNTPDPMFPGANDPSGGFPAGPSGFPGEDINQPFPPMDNTGGGFSDPLPPM